MWSIFILSRNGHRDGPWAWKTLSLKYAIWQKWGHMRRHAHAEIALRYQFDTESVWYRVIWFAATPFSNCKRTFTSGWNYCVMHYARHCVENGISWTALIHHNGLKDASALYVQWISIELENMKERGFHHAAINPLGMYGIKTNVSMTKEDRKADEITISYQCNRKMTSGKWYMFHLHLNWEKHKDDLV